MIVKKVFDVSVKTIRQKSPYVKPKYKTYRQLLDLDRPKRIIQHDSDDENDDFLEKLMKKQQKKEKQQKKKQKQKKCSASKNTTSNKNQSQNQLKSSTPPDHNKQERIPLEKLQSHKQKHNKNHISKNDLLMDTNDKYNKGNENIYENQSLSKHQQQVKSIVVIKRRNLSETNLWQNLELNSNRKTKRKNLDQQKNKIYTILRLSNQQASKSIKNIFLSTMKSKKSDGIKQLQKQVHASNISGLKQNLYKIQSKLNPENKEVEHQINVQKTQNLNTISYSSRAKDFLYKSASSTPIQMILMMNKSANQISSNKKLNTRQTLFKNSYQEEIFLKSLKKR